MPTANEVFFLETMFVCTNLIFVKALNLHTVEATDCEALDLIASYCKEALNNGHRVIIILLLFIVS